MDDGYECRKQGLQRRRGTIEKEWTSETEKERGEGKKGVWVGGGLAEDGELLGSHSGWRGYYRQQSKRRRRGNKDLPSGQTRLADGNRG